MEKKLSEKTLLELDKFKIHIERKATGKRYTLNYIYRKACQEYNFFCENQGCYWKKVNLNNRSKSFLNRIAVNYLRHKCSGYDKLFSLYKNDIEKKDALKLFRNSTFDYIKNLYPELSQEVERQRRKKEKGGGLKAKLHATRDGLGILRFKTLIFPRKKKR